MTKKVYRDEDMVGKKFNMLTVISRAENSKDNKKQYLCKCDCGNERIVKGTELRNGSVWNCGCVHGNKKYENFDLADKSNLRIYRIWNDMKRRCNDPRRDDYERYGGVGISVCDGWMDFQSFYDWSIKNGYDDSLTIDRIDRYGNYEPSNCRWADDYVQANNRKNNHYITYNGKTQTMMQWCRELDISYWIVRSRINSGWDEVKALTTPRLRKKVI